MSGLAFLAATWICYVGFLVLHLLPLLHPCNIVEMCSQLKYFSIGITLVGVHLNWLNRFHFIYPSGRSTRYSNRLHNVYAIIPSCCMMTVSTVSFLTQLDWNSWSAKFFPWSNILMGLILELIDTYLPFLSKELSYMLFMFFYFCCNSVRCSSWLFILGCNESKF